MTLTEATDAMLPHIDAALAAAPPSSGRTEITSGMILVTYRVELAVRPADLVRRDLDWGR